MMKTVFNYLFLALLLGANTSLADSKTVSADFLNQEWQDQAGKTFQFKNIEQQTFAIAIAYTSCQSICPMVAQQISEISKKLQTQSASIPFIFISMDPTVDSPSKRKSFLRRAGAKPDWKFLRASTAAITHQRVSELGMGFVDPENANHVMHTTTLAVLNKSGKILSVIPILPKNIDEAVQSIVSDLAAKN